MNIAGVILAGGKNRRFGGMSKAELIVSGENIISGIIRTISGIFDEIIIVTDRPEKLSELSNYKIVCDIFRDKGPAGGLHAGMKACVKDAVFVFACDMPLLDKQLIESQISLAQSGGYDAVVPLYKGLPEPLHAIYRTSLINRLEKILSESVDTSIIGFLSGLNVNYMEVPAAYYRVNPFTNINYPSDLDDIIRLSDRKST